jgi:hypothetical protein
MTMPPSDQRDFITSFMQTPANSDHALIKAKVIGDGKDDMLHNDKNGKGQVRLLRRNLPAL